MNDYSNKTIGERVASVRKALGMTQQQVADLMCIERNTVSSYEKGRTSINVAAMVQLSEIFGCTLDYLIKGTTAAESGDELVALCNSLTPKTRQVAMIQIEALKTMDVM